MPNYAGSEWIKQYKWGAKISPLGVAVAEQVGDVWCGIYHLGVDNMSLVNWANSHWIDVHVSENLSTFDGQKLTWLVVLAHDRKLRMDIGGMRRGLTLMFHQRQSRQGSVGERMPTMEQHLADIRRYHPAPEESSEVANA